MTDVDMNARYRVTGMPGVAFWLKGYAPAPRECPGHPDGPIMGVSFYCDGTCQEDEVDTSLVIAVMVGDDREHTVDVDDLVKLDEDEFCPECGQIGCTAGLQ